jgi:uncharacterized protein YgiM (DUF1202 family)
MESWKNIGIFLTGFAAVVTTVTTLINHLNEPVSFKQTLDVSPPVTVMCIRDSDGWTNLRSAPSTNSQVLQILKNNDKVEKIISNGNWVKVKTNENIVGYVYHDRLEIIYNDHIIKK